MVPGQHTATPDPNREGHNHTYKLVCKRISYIFGHTYNNLNDGLLFFSVQVCIHVLMKYYAGLQMCELQVSLSLFFRTFRKGCPVQLVLRASEDGNALIVRKFVQEHNHILSKVCIDSIQLSDLISKHWGLTYDLWKLSFLIGVDQTFSNLGGRGVKYCTLTCAQ